MIKTLGRAMLSLLLITGVVIPLNVGVISPASANGDISTSTGGVAKFFAGTNHYYEFVPGPITWTEAKGRAEAATANGLKGYLATISSAGENDFLFALNAGNTWIGATDAAVEGCWRWTNGSSSDLAGPFTAVNSPSGCNPTGAYTKWASGEPNNGGAEHYAVLRNAANWNDISDTQSGTDWGPTGFFIEYGDRADQGPPPALPGLTPVFGARVPDYYAPGFKHQISNYDPAYTWTVSSTVGTAAISSTGLVSVTGVGAKVSATVTVSTSRAGYSSGSASVTSLGPWNLSDEIQAQSITATLSGTTLTVNVPDAKGWTWGLIWSGGVQVSNITSFPYVVNNFTPNKEIQLTATDNLQNFGYSKLFTPTAAIAQAPVSSTISRALKVGSTSTLSGSGGSGTGAFTFASNTPLVCTVSGTTISAITVGTCSISTTKAGDATYQVATATNTFQVAAADPIAQAPLSGVVPSSLTVGSSATLSTSGGSGTGVVTYSSLTPTVCTVSTNIVRAVAVGTCTVYTIKAADATYLSAAVANNFVVTQALMNQALITINTPVSLVAGRTTSFSYSGGSGTGAFSTSTNTPSICTVSGSFVTGVSGGLCQIVVTKAADSNYVLRSAAKSFTVTAAALLSQATVFFISVPASISVNATGTFQVGGGSGTGTWSYSTSTPGICSVSGNQVQGLTSGTCEIVATKAGDTSYLPATVSYSLSIGKTAQSSLSLTTPTSLKSGNSVTLISSGGSGTGSVIYSTSTPNICSVSGSTLTGIANGSCLVTATKLGDANYSDIRSTATVSIQGLLTQTSLSLRTTLTNSAINVGGFYGVSISGGSGTGQITYSTSTPSICSVLATSNPSVIPFQIQGLQAGTCSITVRKAADNDYSEATVSQSYPVVNALRTQAALSILQIQPLSIGDRASIEVTGGSGTGSLSYSSLTQSICSISGNTVFANSTGTCSISVRKAADSEFDVNTSSISFQIRAAKPVASFSTSMNASQPVVGSFYVSGTGSVSSGTSLKISQVCLAIDGSPVTSGEVSNTSGYYWSNGFSYGTNCFNVTNSSWASSSYWSNYRWRLESSSYQPGPHTLTMTVTDSSGTVSDPVSIQITIKSVKPTIQILSPSMGSVVKGKMNLSFLATAAQEADRTIRYLGISEDNAVPTFSNGYNTWSSPFSYGYKAYSMGYGTYSGTFGFQINTQKFEKGLRTIKVAMQDSYGDIVEASVTVDIQAMRPSVQILSPSAGQTFEGVVTIKIQANPDPSSSGGEISYIGIDNDQLTPEFAGVEQNSGSAGFPSSYRTWEVNDVRNFTFTATPGSLKNGLIRLTVLVADDTKATATASVEFKVSTANPTAVIISPVAGTISPGIVTVTAETKPNPISGGRIVALAISERNAKATFFGTPVFNSNNEYISKNFAIWSVDDIQKPSWKIDASTWAPGDRIITVVTQDSNGKIGQGTVVLNIAPKGTFTATLAGPPVLGKSVPISVEMKTNAPYRSAPPVVVTLQSSPTESGPWKDLGDITLDATGKGSGSVVVTAKLWVRAIHKELDAVQPGVGAPLRIVNVPDPNRTNSTSGDKNPDGSTPKVTCVPKSNAKAGKTVSISCSQIDVQDPSQPMQLFVQRKNKFVSAGKASFEDGFIKTSISNSSKGRLTFQVRGLVPEGSKYVVWKSNMFTITWG